MACTPSLLWKIIPDSNDGESCLFGSIHSGGKEFDLLKRQLGALIATCEICAIEVSLDEASAADLSAYHLLSPAQHYTDHVRSRRWDKLSRRLSEKYSFDIQALAGFKPLVIINMFIQQVCMPSDEEVLDEWIWRFGKSAGKRMQGLESLGDHYETLNRIPLDLQYQLLCHAMNDPARFIGRFARLFDKYRAQDIRFLYRDSKKSSGRARHMLIRDRNICMANVIDGLISEGSTFAAVGAAHLYGQHGVINLLRKKGYCLKPMRINF